MCFVNGSSTRNMLLLTENIAEIISVEMLPNCNYQSVLSLRFSCSEYLFKDGRKVKLNFLHKYFIRASKLW